MSYGQVGGSNFSANSGSILDAIQHPVLKSLENGAKQGIFNVTLEIDSNSVYIEWYGTSQSNLYAR